MKKENIEFWGRVLVYTLIFGIISSILWNMVFSSFSLDIAGAPKSTHSREKIIGNSEYEYNCITDESGWITDIRKDKVLLKKFFDKYGVQPYLVIKKIKNSNVSDSERKSYAKEWYSKNVKDENSFLLMYLYTNDSDVGYFTYIAGKNAENVMDNEAADILVCIIQKNLFIKDTPENIIVNAFTEINDYIDYPTATMERYLKTMAAISIVIFLFCAVVAGIYAIILIIAKASKREEPA